MKKILVMLLAILSIAATSYATTYYVRPDGGSLNDCNGTYDAPYPDFSGNRNCALKHWGYIHGVAGSGNAAIFAGGDTMIIDGGTSSQYQYIVGWGSPGITDYSTCGSSWPWGCTMKPIPSGTTTNPTRWLGKGWNTGCTNPPQLWGNERVGSVLNLTGSKNVEVQCLEITDHSECQENGPNACKRDTKPFGPWATNGIYAKDSENVLIKNVNVHGLAYRGIHAGRIKNWRIEDSKVIANSFVGWDGDIGADVSSNTGDIRFLRTKILFSGCGEKLDGTPYNCYSQSQGGYGDGVGLAKTSGNWYFDDVDISYNVSDGLDLLYHDGTGIVDIKNSRFEKNAGNQIKTASHVDISNTYIDGECSDFNGKPYTWKASTFDNCRAMGNTISMRIRKGYQVNLSNITAINNTGDVILQTGGSTCNGSEAVNVIRSKFSADTEYHSGEKVSLFYNSGATGNGDGACGDIPLVATNYSVYNVKNGCPSGALCVQPSDAPNTWGYLNAPPLPCTPNGSCSAPTPACEQVTTGVDNCGNPCTKTGEQCVCIPDGSCSAQEPACGTSTVGIDNCGNTCTKTGIPCPCVPNGLCSAPIPECDQTTTGVDNCGNSCTLVGQPCPECVSNGSCNAQEPLLGQVTLGIDNCNKQCVKLRLNHLITP